VVTKEHLMRAGDLGVVGGARQTEGASTERRGGERETATERTATERTATTATERNPMGLATPGKP